MSERFDVIVLGGGTAGTIAAIQAGRAGMRTLLIEKNGMLGGTSTVAAVSYPGLFHAWGRQVVAGIGWELVLRAVELAGEALPDFSNYRRLHSLLQVRINAGLYASLADEAILAAGVQPLFHTMLAGIEQTADGWNLTLCAKEGLHRVSTLVLVDCSGDANAVGMAGFPRERSERLQPGTLMIRCGGYQFEELDLPALVRAYDAAIADGDLLTSDMANHVNNGRHPVAHFLRGQGQNKIHIVDIDGSTSAGKTDAEIKGRQALLRIFRFFRGKPGLEDFQIEFCATECGIRETCTIVGKAKVTVSDYTSGRLWDDAVSYSFYPVDVHQPHGDGIDIRPLAEGTFPTIPRGALLPEGSRRLIVAGRSAAGDQEASSAYRTQASCMGMGQAAGALAALACRRDCDLDEVPIPDLYELLEEFGAIVPGTIQW